MVMLTVAAAAPAACAAPPDGGTLPVMGAPAAAAEPTGAATRRCPPAGTEFRDPGIQHLLDLGRRVQVLERLPAGARRRRIAACQGREAAVQQCSRVVGRQFHGLFEQLGRRRGDVCRPRADSWLRPVPAPRPRCPRRVGAHGRTPESRRPNARAPHRSGPASATPVNRWGCRACGSRVSPPWPARRERRLGRRSARASSQFDHSGYSAAAAAITSSPATAPAIRLWRWRSRGTATAAAASTAMTAATRRKLFID